MPEQLSLPFLREGIVEWDDVKVGDVIYWNHGVFSSQSPSNFQHSEECLVTGKVRTRAGLGVVWTSKNYLVSLGKEDITWQPLYRVEGK